MTVTAAPDDCSFQFNPANSPTVKFLTSCDIAKAQLAKTSVNYSTVEGAAGAIAEVKIGETVIASLDGVANAAAITAAKAALDEAKVGIDAAALTALTGAEAALKVAKAAVTTAEGALKKATDGTDEAAKTAAQTALDAANAAVPASQAALDTARVAVPADILANYDAAAAVVATESGLKGGFEKSVNDALKAAGYPMVAADNTTVAKAQTFIDIFTAQKLTIIAVLTYLIILVTMVYGPIAAMLVELFPTRIIYAGLWYAIVVAVMTVVIGTLFVPGGTHKKDIFADDQSR